MVLTQQPEAIVSTVSCRVGSQEEDAEAEAEAKAMRKLCRDSRSSRVDVESDPREKIPTVMAEDYQVGGRSFGFGLGIW